MNLPENLRRHHAALNRLHRMFSDPPAAAAYTGETSPEKKDGALEAELEELEAELEAEIED